MTSNSDPVVVVVVLAYEAETTLTAVLDDIPEALDAASVRILITDDASTDRTTELARAWAAAHPHRSCDVVQQPMNLGYGGNQKFGYVWAIDHGADVAVLLHGDGQYPAARIGDLAADLLADAADASFGSRMSTPGAAKAGGMPWTRRYGNRALSWMQNLLTGANLTEWHSGFRAYRVDALRQLRLDDLTDGFDFDTDISLALLCHDARFSEIQIPTHYGDEISRIDVRRAGWDILKKSARFGWNRRVLRRRQSAGPDPT